MYIASSDTSPMDGIKGLADALFPDPAKRAQAQYYGAEAGKVNQSSADMLAAAEARAGLGTARQTYLAHPSPENATAFQSQMLQAGFSLKDATGIMLSGGSFGGGVAGGPTGQAADLAALYSGNVSTYGATPTGQAQGEASSQKVASIGAAPAMLGHQLDVRKYNDTRTPYADPSAPGQVNYMRPGETPAPNTRPLADIVTGETQTATTERQRIATAPSLLEQQRQDRLQGGLTKPFIIPNSTNPTGLGMVNNPVEQQPPPGAVPFDVANPSPLPSVLYGPQRTGPAVGTPEDMAQRVINQSFVPKTAELGAKEGLINDARLQDKVKQYNLANPGSLDQQMLGMKTPQLSPAALSAIQERANTLMVDPSNTKTKGQAGPALDQAWSEISPTLVHESHYPLSGQTGSFLRLPSEGQAPNPGPGAGAPAAAPVSPPEPAAAPAPPVAAGPTAPPSPSLADHIAALASHARDVLAAPSRFVGARMHAAAPPAPAPAAPAAAAPATPNAPLPYSAPRVVGQAYQTAKGVLVWTGQPGAEWTLP